MSDHEHWLWRLSADDWLEAARHELEQASRHLGARRRAVTHARRGAGMALNGVLVAMSERGWSRERCETVWGRSYIDHLRALSTSSGDDTKELRGPFQEPQFEQCRILLAIPIMPPSGLVPLATRKDEAANQAIATATEISHACAVVIHS